MRILFVTPRLPFPTHVGYQVRAVEQLRRLTPTHRVTLLAFEDATADACEGARERLGLERVVVGGSPPLARVVGAAGALVSGEPLQCGIFDTSGFRASVARLVTDGAPFDLAHVQLARLAPAVEHALPVRLPRVIDLVDALSLNMTRRARRDRGVTAHLAGVEGERLARHERSLLDRWDHATVVTEADRVAIADHPRLTVNPNGVDLERFAPDRGVRPAGQVVFTGNLGYFPNVHAAEWLLTEVWPRVIAARPAARLALVGARPDRRVIALARRTQGVDLVGPVDELAVSLASAEVAVAPLGTGSGQPLKILEALAAGTPVVATAFAVSALEARAGEHLLVADGALAFAAAVVRLLDDPALRARLARAGRTLAEARYGWDAPVTALGEIWQAAVTGHFRSSGAIR